MTRMVARYFDKTKTLVLDTPLNVPDGATVEIQVKESEACVPAIKKARTPGRRAGEGWISPDFNDPLPDSFWLSGNP
jgi:hypothetical protein